jgi:GGDEF domain-containing protein
MIVFFETKLDQSHALAERAKKAIESNKFDNVGNVTVSLGVTEFK